MAIDTVLCSRYTKIVGVNVYNLELRLEHDRLRLTNLRRESLSNKQM